MAETERDTPKWLKEQIAVAEKAAPVGMPLGTPAEDPDLAGQEETFRGEPEVANPSAKKKARKIKDQDTTSEPQNPDGFFDIASELAEMLSNKNRKYGDSYARMAHVLPVFYPDGVPGNHLLDAVFILRIVDKLMRIASAQADDEEDPVKDIAGYAILRMREMRKD